MSASKKRPESVKDKVVRRPRLTQDEARTKMLQATIDLLLTEAPGDITVHMISRQAGVHHDYVARYFGSREELFAQAADMVLVDFIPKVEGQTTKELVQTVVLQSSLFELMGRRYRLIAYLLAQGVPPSRFHSVQRSLLDMTVQRIERQDLSPRAQRNFTLIGMMLLQAISTMGSLNELSDQDRADIFAFIGSLQGISSELSEALGWNAEKKRATKKKTAKKQLSR